MNSLLSKLVDPAHLVRRLCIKGLGNVASAGGHKVTLGTFHLVFSRFGRRLY